MKTGDCDDAIRIAIRQITDDWKKGKTETRPAMMAIVTLIDYALPREERTIGVVYPLAENELVDPLESDTSAGYCAGGGDHTPAKV